MEILLQGKRYTIFVSSTFKDMDGERDMIKFNVLNRLNRKYRDKHVQFQIVDLRLGINTENIPEEKREDCVLDVCLSNIDNARPFFIGLLGERYGWIPGTKRWETIVSRLSETQCKLLQDSCGCSVTEMEILYGAIGNHGEYLNHSLFFLRDKNSYKNVPEDLLPLYDDLYNPQLLENERLSNHAKLENLKERILSVSCDKKINNITEYSLQWDNNTRRFLGLTSFADTVFDKLCEEIDKEIESTLPNLSWYVQEQQNIEYIHQKNNYRKIERTIFSELRESVSGGGQILLTGDTGCGKSVLLSQIYHSFCRDESYICLSAFVGISYYSQEMKAISIRWILLLQENENFSSSQQYTTEQLREKTIGQLYSIFTDTMRELEEGKQVICFLDGVEQFERLNAQDIYLPWLSDDIALVATVSGDVADKILLHNSKIKKYDIETLDHAETGAMIDQYEKFYNIELPLLIKQDILRRDLLPVQLTLLMIVFSHLSTKDFIKIRSLGGDSEIDNINNYLIALYREIPLLQTTELFRYTIEFLVKTLAFSPSFHQIFQYIAISGGIREGDLEKLMDKEWNELNFHIMMFIMDDFFIENRLTRQWYLKSATFAQALEPRADLRPAAFENLAGLMLSYEDTDSRKQEILFYYLIASENASIGKDYLTSKEFRLNNPASFKWYTVSIRHLLQDPDLAKHVRVHCRQYTSGECIRFIYGLWNGLHYMERPQLFITLVDENLTSIQVENLQKEEAYLFAYLYEEAYLATYHSFLKTVATYSEEYYLKRAIEGFQRCHDLDSTYVDTKNMLKAMMLRMIPIYAKKGDLPGMKNYLLLINKL